MESNPAGQPISKGSNPRLKWLILVVVLVLAIAMVIYAITKDDGATNADTTVNQNTNVAANANTVLNTNAITNTNSVRNANTNNAVNSNTNTSVNTTGWEMYENGVWGFSFKYPKEWTFISDSLPKEVKSETSPKENLLIGLPIDNNQNARPSISIILNPSGFGPVFPDLVYTITKSVTGFTVVEERTTTTDAALEPGFYQIQANTSSDTPTFDMFFSTNEKDQNTWAATVKQILSTFRFTN